MLVQENINHDLLLIIVSILFIIFVAGCESSDGEFTAPIIIP